MAITFVNAGAEFAVASGNGTIAFPASPVSGDIWILAAHSTDQIAHSISANWTQIAQGNGGGTTSRLSAWWFRYAGSNPTATLTHTAGDCLIGGVAAYRGCIASGSPIDVAGTVLGGTDVSMETTAITTTTANTMVVAALGSGNDNNYTAAPSGMTLRLEDVGGGVQGNYQTTLGLDGCVGIADKIQASIGGSGTLTNTQDTATAWATVLFALTEEVAAGHPAMRRIGMPMYGVGGVRVQ